MHIQAQCGGRSIARKNLQSGTTKMWVVSSERFTAQKKKTVYAVQKAV